MYNFWRFIFYFFHMAELSNRPELTVSDAERMSLFKLQIDSYRSQLLEHKNQGTEDDEVDDLMALCNHAEESLENWGSASCIGEMLANLGARIDGLGSRQERYSSRICREIQQYVCARSVSSLPPPA
jgi:hypothetical protein